MMTSKHPTGPVAMGLDGPLDATGRAAWGRRAFTFQCPECHGWLTYGSYLPPFCTGTGPDDVHDPVVMVRAS